MSVLLALTAGCMPHGAVDDSDEEADVEADAERLDYGSIEHTPYVHVRQTVVIEAEGKSVSESHYRMLASGCGTAFAPSVVKLLSDEDASRLGRTYYEAWYHGTRMAVRADSWELVDGNDQSTVCMPTVRHESMLRIVTPEGRWDIDLDAGTGDFTAGSDFVRVPLRDPQGSTHAEAVEYAATAKDEALGLVDGMRELLERGAALMPKAAGTQRVAGQTCDAYRQTALNTTYCYWNGGRDWGFDDADPSDVGIGAYETGLLLFRRLDVGATMGYTVTTDEMSVGDWFDEKVFAVPEGIAITTFTDEDEVETQFADDDDDDAYDDDEEDDEDAEPLTLNDLRQLGRVAGALANDKVQLCLALPGNMVMSMLETQYVPALGRATPDFRMTPEMIETAAEQMGSVAPLLKDPVLRDAHQRLARAIRAQKGQPDLAATPEMLQAYGEITNWLKQNCTEEAFGLSKGELGDQE